MSVSLPIRPSPEQVEAAVEPWLWWLWAGLRALWGWLAACAAQDGSTHHSAAVDHRETARELRQVDVDAWYRRYGEAVHRRCLRLTRNEAQAMDLVQETFLRAHKYRRSYRGEAKPLSWLLTISDRCFFDTLRRKEPVDAREVEDFVREEEEGADVLFARHDLVCKLLTRAARDVRQIVVLRYFDELDNHQIDAHLDVNERTVRRKLDTFLSNARKFVRRS